MKTQKTILVVEDEKSLCKAIVDILSRNNFLPIEAKNGKEGVELALSRHPDLILLDILLPKMNGYEILEAKQKDPSIASIPVIVVSNSGQPVEIDRVMAFGVKDYLVKSQFDPEEVLVKVREQLKKR